MFCFSQVNDVKPTEQRFATEQSLIHLPPHIISDRFLLQYIQVLAFSYNQRSLQFIYRELTEKMYQNDFMSNAMS
jgi:23S rRNA maturation-related 3'-5' exoribonuclease YhaM